MELRRQRVGESGQKLKEARIDASRVMSAAEQ
jgi:hypothetical protein